MLFKNFRNLKRVLLRNEVDFMQLFKFPILKHIDYIEVRKNTSVEDIKKLISLSPNEMNFERIFLSLEQLYEILRIIRDLTVEKAILKLTNGYMNKKS